MIPIKLRLTKLHHYCKICRSKLWFWPEGKEGKWYFLILFSNWRPFTLKFSLKTKEERFSCSSLRVYATIEIKATLTATKKHRIGDYSHSKSRPESLVQITTESEVPGRITRRRRGSKEIDGFATQREAWKKRGGHLLRISGNMWRKITKITEYNYIFGQIRTQALWSQMKCNPIRIDFRLPQKLNQIWGKIVLHVLHVIVVLPISLHNRL